MERAAAHAALDALLDHLERSRSANDPEAQIAAEAEAHEAWQLLAAGVAGSMIARRLGAAWHGRHPDDPDGAQPAARETARVPLLEHAPAEPAHEGPPTTPWRMTSKAGLNAKPYRPFKSDRSMP